MFSKILIANRGEIAVRVMRTCQRMGIATVAVYSDADDGAMHMRMADEAVHIGPPPAAQSYLLIDRIVQACRDTGAQAVHPGYGFLSENQAFAAALEEAGIAFIGPGRFAIQAMGDKIESKKLAHKAGVSTVPGYLGVIADADEAVKIANDVGYPVMIKASAGGGGKGMRIARSDAEVHEGFKSAMNEARSSFGDDRVFIEKYVEEPRHIEIQVLGDAHGNVIYLGERECSIQRRHQKVVEEAPSPFLDAATRKAMGEQAVALAKAVDYKSAGTVEFIVDRDRNFYFLEMNTRLQVEHPVTALVTGIDLVEQMIRVADGEKLALQQSDVKLNGWAIESRIYAEDPYRGFLPSIGRLSRCRFPDLEGVRVDTGVGEGSEITMFYDPMIAKLCSYGADRAEAIDVMRAALDRTWIEGISHNVDFVNAVANHPRFREGRLSTNFIAEEYPDGFDGAALGDETRTALVAIAAHLERIARAYARTVGSEAAPELQGRDRFVVWLDEDRFQVEISGEAAAQGWAHRVSVDGAPPVMVSAPWRPGETVYSGQMDGLETALLVRRHREGWRLTLQGAEVKAFVRTPRVAELAELMPVKAPPDMSKYLLCPMPGLVVSIDVAVGDPVKAGQPLAVVEAMKMENVLRAERDGTVSEVKAKPGDSLAVDEVILEFE
ncbi:MAG: acetyl/propionyl/methylcrotonyl-CoA carboxylase subunit alpha [Sneathiellaceae bacterium]